MTHQDKNRIHGPDAVFCGKIAAALETGEKALRHFHPALVSKLRERIIPRAEIIEQALEDFRSEDGADPAREEVRSRLIRTAPCTL